MLVSINRQLLNILNHVSKNLQKNLHIAKCQFFKSERFKNMQSHENSIFSINNSNNILTIFI